MTIVRNKVSMILFALSLAFIAQPLTGLEQPDFELVEELGSLQIRKYPSHIVAQTLVTGSFDDAGDQGFKRLAGFIFGGNEENQKIAMTAPVDLERTDRTSLETKYWVTFNMPREHSMQTLPIPTDSRIDIVERPEKYLAVLRYKGNWSEERFRSHEANLLSLVGGSDSWESQGETSWSRYNPPFVPWFLRTNEVAVEVTRINRVKP